MVQGAAAQADRMSYGIRHCERSEAIQSGLRTLWIAASPSAPRNDEGLFRRRLVGLFPRACPRIEELAPIGLGHILGDAVMFGPAVLRQVEGAEDLVEEGEVDREIDVESLAFEPVVPVVEAWGREPGDGPVETAPDLGGGKGRTTK